MLAEGLINLNLCLRMMSLLASSFRFGIMIQCILFMQAFHVVYYVHIFTAKGLTLLSISCCLFGVQFITSLKSNLCTAVTRYKRTVLSGTHKTQQHFSLVYFVAKIH